MSCVAAGFAPNEPQSLAVTRADTALYQAKGTGKNKVVRI